MIGSLVRRKCSSDFSESKGNLRFGTVIDRAIADRVMVLWSNGNTETIDPYYLEIIADSREEASR